MEIDFFKASELESNVKCTIHRNGRLGFNGNSIKFLKISEFKYVRIGKGIDYAEDGTLYMQLVSDKNLDGFSLSLAGGYYYANTRMLFEKLGFDFINLKIICNYSGHFFKIY